MPFLQAQYGNASSQYTFGVRAKYAVDHARRQIASALNAEPESIIFTSGGSEANTWVIRCTAERFFGEPIHIVTTIIEHTSVLNACKALEAYGVEVTYLPVDEVGRVSALDVKAAIRPNTKLVSVMLANNEVGTIQPISEIGKILKERGILFHTDAVQAVGHIPVDVQTLNVDFLSASAHKFNGAKGVGILYIRPGLHLPHLIFGGGQELDLRAGTENVAGIVAAGCALEENSSLLKQENEKVSTLVALTVHGLRTAIPQIRFNAEYTPKLPGTLSVTFPYATGESIMHLLDLKGICVSTGSACKAGTSEPSHVLRAMGLTEQQAKSTIRISYGRGNNAKDAEEIVRAIVDICKEHSHERYQYLWG